MAQNQTPAAAVSAPPNGVAPVPAPNANQFVTTSLYVGDLDLNVNDSQLYDLFNQVGQVVSVRVCRDLTSRRSLGYGYVNFSNPQDAARALDVLNFTPLNNKQIRVMYSHRDPSIRKSGTGNIFIKNLDKAIDHKALHDTFSTFGHILSCKIATDASGHSKGYGFVQFETEESAQTAIDKLNGMLINDKQVYVGPFLRKQDRENVLGKTTFNNVYVKNLSDSFADDDLKKVFGEYGTITSAVVMRDADGRSKCFGFVNFESPDDAAKAVEALNGKKFDDKEWYVGKAQKKTEREQELKGRFEQTIKESAEKYQGVNLYIKNLDDAISDEKLKEMFAEFGTIASYKVMRDANGVSRGSGFVAFSTPEEASRALGEMNGKMISGKPLYVALAQRKEERRARLQAQFSQMRPVAITPSVAPRMPLYTSGAPGLGQQFLYGQGPPAMIPPQGGFGYQQQLVPGMRPGGGPMGSFFVPIVQQGQQGQRPGGRRGAGPVQQQQQAVPMMQQQMLPRPRYLNSHQTLFYSQSIMGMVFGKIGVETPKYEVIKTTEDYEIRKYPPSVSAEVTYDPSQFKGNKDGGFMVLANYIGALGNPQNTKPEKIAMTAPVITKETSRRDPGNQGLDAGVSEKIAMTAPVVTKEGGKMVTMEFILPSIYGKAEEAPKPVDERVVIREEGERKYGVVKFGGVASEEVVKEKVEKLRMCLERDGFKVVGEFLLARYNPPWTIPVFRTNEVMIPVE